MKITVLTSCYNASKFIKESIESVLNQTYKEFEYLLIDDGSTDDTLNVLKEFASKDDRIKIIEKHNSGLTKSLNVGLKEAKGRWIARLDADDIALPYRLEKQLKVVEVNNDLVLVGGGAILIDENSNELSTYNCPPYHNILLKRLEKNRAFFAHSSVFYNKHKVLELGGYDNFFERSQDKDLWYRIAEKYRISCLNVPVVKLRKHQDMLSSKNNRLQIEYSMFANVLHFARNKKNYLLTNNIKSNLFIETQKVLDKVRYFHLLSDWQDFKKSSCDKKGVLKNIFLLFLKILTNMDYFKIFYKRIMIDRNLKKIFIKILKK